MTSTPADVFTSITANEYGWQFSGNAVEYTLASDKTLATLTVPDGTLCSAVIQEVVWDQTDPSKNTPFLAAPTTGQPWTDQVEIAVGNTTVQAVSALVKSHLAAPGGSDSVLASYETLLNALQLGVLRDLEGQGNALATLEQSLHERAFSQIDGGHRWTIQTKAAPGSQASVALTLPLTLAEQLTALNNAQLAYDQARSRITAARQQLFMDWISYVKQLSRKPPGTNVVATNTLGAFLATSGSGELRAVTNAGAAAGLLHYQNDDGSGRITGVTADGAATTLAGQVVSAHDAVAAALAKLPDGWELDAVPADSFWLPTDPVLVLEGSRLEPVRRNGPVATIAVRADSELIGALRIAGASGNWTVPGASLPGLTVPPSALPAAAAIAEAALLDPQYAAAIATATGAADRGTLAAAIAACQGGQSPLDPPVAAGLYSAVHAAGYQRAPDPAQSVQAPAPLTVTFANAAGTALPPERR